jgi:hypothetical protein
LENPYDKLAHSIVERKNTLKTSRSNVDSVCEQISEFVLPNRGDFITKRASEGQRNNSRLFDTTAIHANEMLAAAIHTGGFSPSSKWFDLRLEDKVLSQNENVRLWLESAMNTMYRDFDSSFGNFYPQNHEFLLDLTAYGTSCMYVEEAKGRGIRFMTRHLSQIHIDEDMSGNVDTVFYAFEYTARQALQAWGEEKLPRKIKEALVTKPQEKFNFIHAIMPREDALRLTDGTIKNTTKRHTYVGMYVMEDGCHVLDSSGFYEMPYIVCRWEKLIGERYGRSPAWNALPDIRTINVMSETILRAAQKMVDPPLLVADDGVVMPMRTHPNGINVGGLSQDGKPLIAPLQSGARLDIGLEMMDQRRQAIRRAFYVDQFTPKDGTPITATESQYQQENALRLTGPQLSRIHSEYASRLISRVFNINMRSGKFGRTPDELANVDVRIDYINPLSRLQRSHELVALNRAVEASLPILEYKPDVLDILDGDALFRNSLEVAGVALQHTKKKADVDKERQSRAQQQQQQQAAMMANEAGQTAAKMKTAGMEV